MKGEMRIERIPRRPHDEEPRGPEEEHMEPSIIDMTGVVEQDDALVDVIGDAIGEAEAGNGIIPEWGARTIARALANETGEPHTGALHHYAVTGRIDRQKMLEELAAFTGDFQDEEARVWANWLTSYVYAHSEQPPADSTSAPTETNPEAAMDFDEDDQIIFGGSAVAKVNHYLQAMFTEADIYQTVISRDDARIIATLLAAILGENSAMHRFAEDDDLHRSALLQECSYLVRRTASQPDLASWLPRLEQFLSAQPDET
jgi:hypothetical protein